jgi:hypothetical protein
VILLTTSASSVSKAQAIEEANAAFIAQYRAQLRRFRVYCWEADTYVIEKDGTLLPTSYAGRKAAEEEARLLAVRAAFDEPIPEVRA